jgi:hypothetical protein
MEVHATEEGALELLDAPPNSVCELRWQNTMNGKTVVQTVEVGVDGSTRFAPPLNYSEAFALSIRCNGIVSDFTRDPGGLTLATPKDRAVDKLIYGEPILGIPAPPVVPENTGVVTPNNTQGE